MEFHTRNSVQSWGRIGSRVHQIARPRFSDQIRHPALNRDLLRLPVGSLRSYSDVCLSDGGHLVDMTGLCRFRSFDPITGILVAESGVTLDEVLRHFVPRGYFLPVTPGTRHATLGGAVANDVHGKNHHRAGTFGCHVKSLVIERSDAGLVTISPTQHPDLFRATIGGLGLTGIVTEVALKLQKIGSSYLDLQTRPCGNLDELCDGLESGHLDSEHVVAWIDCTASGNRLGRGLVRRANWASDGRLDTHRATRRTIPTDRLSGLLNAVTVRAFNAAYYAKGKWNAGTRLSHYDQFLYPLDSVAHWNRLYGRKGFYQYQCVIPRGAGRDPLRELISEIAASREGSFLAVLKRFDDRPSPGLLSFPKPGLTLALDFQNKGSRTLELFARLDAIVEAAGGRLYAAKDMRIPPISFRRAYSRFDEFCRFVDPACQSDFWKKLHQ